MLSVEESSAEKSNSYRGEVVRENTISKGLILKELSEHLNYAFLQPEQAKPVIISFELTELEEQNCWTFSENTKKQ